MSTIAAFRKSCKIDPETYKVNTSRGSQNRSSNKHDDTWYAFAL